jgi:hypothetical protein
MLYFKSAILLSIAILLSACGRDPIPPYQDRIYHCPRLKILRDIPANEYPKDFKLEFKEQNGYLLVKPEDLSHASAVSQKKSIIIKKQKRHLEFYKNEILKYNKEYARKK